MYRGAILGLQKQVFFNVVNAGLATVRYAGAIGVLAWISSTIEAFFIWQAAISIVSIVVLAKSVHRSLPAAPKHPTFSWGALKEIRHFASGMMVATLLALLLTQVDKILLSRLLDLEEFGYYTLAGVLAGVVSLLINPIAQAVSPHMAKLATNQSEEGLVGAYHNAAQLMTVMAAPMALIISIFAEGAIFAWSGNQGLAEKTGPILSVLVIGNLLSAVMVIPFMLQLAYGWVSFAIKFNLVAVLLLIPAILFVVPRFGALGAAWVWVILNMSYILIGIQLMHRRFIAREKWTWYINDISYPTIGALVTCLLASIFSPTGYESRWSWAVFLIISSLLALSVAAMSADLMRKRVLFHILKKNGHG
jgi:O-antigen/teichoic acid export membrane protein